MPIIFIETPKLLKTYVAIICSVDVEKKLTANPTTLFLLVFTM